MKLIRTNIWAVILIIALAFAWLTYFVSNNDFHTKTVSTTTKRIDFFVDVKTKLIESKLNSVQQELKLLSTNTKNDVYFSQANNASESINSPITKEDKGAAMHTWAASMLQHYGFYDLIFVNNKGKVFFSTKKENTLGQNLTSVNDTTKYLSETYTNIVQSKNDFVISDFHISNTTSNPSVSFFCGTVNKDTAGNILGVIILQIPVKFISSELDNSLLMDSLQSYITSSTYAISDVGEPTTLQAFNQGHNASDYIYVTGHTKIKNLWTITSALPMHLIINDNETRIAMLNGCIAFFTVCILGILFIVVLEHYKKSKGVTSADILLVQTSWNYVSEYSTDIIQLFYKYLFESAPEVKPMFKSDQATQEKRMASMINTIVNSVDSLDEFRGSISQLAKSHTHMGVKKHYFPIVVLALVNSVEEQYGKGFTPAHKKAWIKILTHISNIMIEEMEFYQNKLKKPE